jgi:hypothetical protein
MINRTSKNTKLGTIGHNLHKRIVDKACYNDLARIEREKSSKKRSPEFGIRLGLHKAFEERRRIKKGDDLND